MPVLSRVRALLFTLIVATPTVLLADGIKSASKFCLANLSATEQWNSYSRLATIGASYTHGCSGCDKMDSYRVNLAQSDDSFWLRRNPVLQFWARAAWKSEAFGFDFIAAAENDPKHRPLANVPRWQQALQPYDGLWTYHTRRDRVSLMDEATRKAVLSQTTFFEDLPLIGGLNKGPGDDPKPTSRGILYQTVPAELANSGARSRQYFDLSIDGGRKEDIFRVYGSNELYEKLSDGGWKDEALRRELIERTLAHLRNVRPSLLLGLDILFWDSFSHSLSILRAKNPKSFTVKVMTRILATTKSGKQTFDDVRRANINKDFYELLERFSRGEASHPAVPVLVAPTMRDPKKFFSENPHLIGSLLSQYVRWHTGLELTQILIPGDGSQDFSGAEGRKHSRDPFGNTSTRTSEWGSAVANMAVLNAAGDLPLFVEALAEAFQATNALAQKVTSSPSNHVYLMNPETFYSRFSKFLKPEIMHPSFSGALQIASFLEHDLCKEAAR